MTDDAVILIEGPSGHRRLRLTACLDPAAAERAASDAIAWIKSSRQLRVDDLPFRDRFTYRGDSLWWFAELYLGTRGIIREAFETIYSVEALIDRERPARLTLSESGPLARVIVPQVARARGVAYEGPTDVGLAPSAARRRRRMAWRHAVETVIARLGRRPARPAAPADLAVFVHSAFWRGNDAYIGPVLRELGARMPDGIRLVGLGPRTSYRARVGRRWRRATPPQPLPFRRVTHYGSLTAVLPSLRLWRDRHSAARALLGSPALREAASVRGCDLWPIVREELADVATLQLPWSARAMDEVGAALDTLQPKAVVTYAEAGGWGRALVLEARRRGIPVVGLQHGFIFRHWLNYLHEPDELRPSPVGRSDTGFPRPDLTLVFDGQAAEHLRTAGNFPEEAVQITGSPRLEAVMEAARGLTAADLDAARTRAGAHSGQPLVVLATKFTDIEPEFPALLQALAAVGDVRVAVKSHPAESPERYVAAAGAAPNLTVLPADTDLAPLVAAARLLVTVNSTVAVDALVLGVPVLTLRLPNNLSPFVDAGAMAGLPAGAPVEPVLRSLLYDECHRAQLAAGGRALVERYGLAPEPGAAARAADAIVALLQRRP